MKISNRVIKFAVIVTIALINSLCNIGSCDVFNLWRFGLVLPFSVQKSMLGSYLNCRFLGITPEVVIHMSLDV